MYTNSTIVKNVTNLQTKLIINGKPSLKYNYLPYYMYNNILCHLCKLLLCILLYYNTGISAPVGKLEG